MEIENALKIAYTLRNAGKLWQRVELARSLGFPDTLAGNIARAIELIRAHRLWERYLVDREGVPLDAVHTEADLRKHELTPKEVEKLYSELKYPAGDPHGHTIPAPGSSLLFPAGQSLLKAVVPGSGLRIVRLDDETAELLTQLVTLGLEPGVSVDISSLVSSLMRLQSQLLMLQIWNEISIW